MVSDWLKKQQKKRKRADQIRAVDIATYWLKI